MADVFDEVEEQLRSARYAEIARRSWPYAAAVLAAVVAVVVGWKGWDAYRDHRDAVASQDYAKALAALKGGDAAGAGRLFAQVSREGAGGYKALALMQQAGLKLQAAKPLEAVPLLDAAAAATSDPALHDAAALEAAFVAMDRAPLAQSQSRFTPLIATGRPYRSLAREGLAMAKLAAGRTAEAKQDLQLLGVQQDVSENARSRAQAALQMIDSGAAAVIPAVVRAQAAAPPMPLPSAAAQAGPPGAPQ